MLERKAVSGIILTLLLMAASTSVFNFHSVKASPRTYIFIRADGSVDPPDAPIQRDGDVYTFTDNISYPDYYGIIVYRSNIIVDGNGYTRQGPESEYAGIYLEIVNNVTIQNMNIENCYAGVQIYWSDFCVISGNNITHCHWGVFFHSLSSNIVRGNNITNNDWGVFFRLASDNTVFGNMIANNQWGVQLNWSSNNKFRHNNFIDNTQQVYIGTPGYANFWDDGYPSGGNYWSDYEDRYPDAEEIDGSSIWDTPYEIDVDNIDRYPLINPYHPSRENMRVLMTEDVYIFGNGSCRLNIVMNITSPPLSVTYSSALGWNESLPDGVYQKLPKTITFDSPKNLTFDESVEVEHDPGLIVMGEIPVKSAFCNATRDQQRLSLGINITEWIAVNMCRVGGAFWIYVDAYAEFLQYEKSGNNWNVSIGPSDLNASTDRANFILTQIMFTQQMLGSFAGEQTYDSLWVTNIVLLPPEAFYTNYLELLGKNWTMDFGGGTYMKAIIGPCIEKSVTLTETMRATEKKIDVTKPKQLVDNRFLCYKIFNLKYVLPGGGGGCCETKSAACADDFSWGIDLTLAQFDQDLVRLKFSDTYPINETVTVGVNVTMGVRFILKLKAHFDLKTKWLSLKRFRAWLQLQGSMIVDFIISVNGTYEKVWEQHLFDWKSKKPYTFFVGPVPVEVNPYFNATAELDFKMEGEVSISFEANATGWLRAGVGWKEDNGFYSILDAGMEVTRDGPTFSSQLYVEVTPSLVFTPTLLFYDIVGPSAEIQPYAKLHMGLSDGTFGWNITAGLNVNAGIAFSGWFKKITDLDDYYWNIFDWAFWTFPREEAGVHDVAVSNVRVPTQTFINENLTVSVDVANVGDFNDTANVTFYYKKKDDGEWTPFGWNTSELTTVKNWTGSFTTLTFNYNTTEMTSGKYYISANATIVDYTDADTSDNSRYNSTRLDERNVAVVDVTPLETEVNVGDNVDINVTVMNKGTCNVSTLPVFVYYDGKPISDVWCEFAHWVFDLENGTTETLTFTWNTKGVKPDEYTISAEAALLLYETNKTDNKLTADDTITVQAVPLDVSINPISVTMDVFQSKVFNSDVSGGTPPYTYQWYLDGIPVLGATYPTWTFTPRLRGSYTVHLNVTDNVDVTAKSNVADVTVNPELDVSISPDEVVMDEGQSQEFTSEVTGGTSPYDYQWYVDGSPVSGATNPTYTYTPPSPSSHTIYLKVTDSVQATKNSNTAYVTVNPALQVSISPTSAVIELGQSVSFTSSVSGGTSPYSYQWYKNGAPVSGATGSTWTFTPTSSGSYQVYLKVTDNVGATKNSNTAYVTVKQYTPPVGGIWVPVDKLGLLAPYIGLASTLIVATVAAAIYVERVKRRKEKQ